MLQAKVGGQIGVNGYCYRGGQFLPNTQAEPGKWKINGKWVRTGKEQIEPFVWAVQPTPFSRSILRIAGAGHATRFESGKLVVNTGVYFHDRTPVTPDAEVRPGVRGVCQKEGVTLQALCDAYNNGLRWFDVNPEGVQITSKE